ncbi:cell wall hydrolase [Roseomonas sp. SSH11]|uniref:Cell wall hydrolase n=1 Tax=Pararoseomonas baculiformis TaxID=2820812 RepID=A0ABS4AI00_9PROT|nr:cell wall hydrolase [Pararoseomonas baculiformis]MBP0446655.1 cell wall hydrolase [Pararoseomonas baculiformis]
MDATEALSRVLFAEAGARPVRAIEALAALAVNRARAAMPRPARVPGAAPFAPGGHARLPEPGASEMLALCRDPFLFPCRNPRSPGHARLADPPAEEASALATCRRIAARALAGVLPDPTGGATHWHAADNLPAWAVARAPLAEMGGLVFYRLETGARPAHPLAPALVA